MGIAARFAGLTIRLKLALIIIGMTAAALVVSSILELALNWTTEQRQILRRLEVTAQIISLQTRAALEFSDPAAARENLVSLSPDPNVRKACIYDEQGNEFTSYAPLANDGHDSECPPVAPPSYFISNSYINLFHEIRVGDRLFGTIYLSYDLQHLYVRFLQELLYKIGIVLLVITGAWPLSFYFQRIISRPVIELATLTRRFAHDRTQELQAVKRSDDEIGELVDAFNSTIKEIQRNDRKLEQAIAELTRSNTELERFAYICSHDLQEPLRMVSNYTNMLERRFSENLDDTAKQYLFFITDGAARMRELINDILSYARIGNHVEPMQKVDTRGLVEYVIQNLEGSIKESGAQIIVGTLPEIQANKTLIAQVFQNLISNALKFCKIAPKVTVNAERIDDGWKFSVRDNGIGIDPKYFDKIFEIFKRLNRREEFHGTGIGLAICKKAIDYHGGRIWVESAAGEGTTFFFTIPDINLKETAHA